VFLIRGLNHLFRVILRFNVVKFLIDHLRRALKKVFEIYAKLFEFSDFSLSFENFKVRYDVRMVFILLETVKILFLTLGKEILPHLLKV
jgi:hypothetical protein